jgi:hypothetical protein
VNTIPTAPKRTPSKNRLNRSAESYIRGLLTDVITASGNEVQKLHFVAFAAGTSARGDALATEKAIDFDTAVIPAVDQDVSEVGH